MKLSNKNNDLLDFFIEDDLQILSDDEAREVNAGESGWYWIAYGVGAVARGFGAFLDGVAYSSNTMPGLK